MCQVLYCSYNNFRKLNDRKINEEFDFLWVELEGQGGVLEFQKFEKASYRTEVLTHTANFSTLAQL